MIKDHEDKINLPRKKLEFHDYNQAPKLVERGKWEKNIVHKAEEISKLWTLIESHFILIKVRTYSKAIIRYFSVLNNIASEYIVFFTWYILLFLTDVFNFLIYFEFYFLPIPLPFPGITIVSHLDFSQSFSNWCSKISFCLLFSSLVFFSRTVARGLFAGKSYLTNPPLKLLCDFLPICTKSTSPTVVHSIISVSSTIFARATYCVNYYLVFVFK